jgi:hypothetical protein
MKHANIFIEFIQQNNFQKDDMIDFLYDVYTCLHLTAFKSFAKNISNCTDRPLCIWGAGYNGTLIARLFCEYTDMSIEITDKNPSVHGKLICNHAVKPWDIICNNVNYVIVCTPEFLDAVSCAIGPEYTIIDFEGHIRHIEQSELGTRR